MAFKGEISAEFLDNVKTGFTVGDIYRIIDAGKLGGVDIPFGAFVEWRGEWIVRPDIQLATNADIQSLEEHMFARETIAASTLRFSFGDLTYDPTTDTTVASRHNTADRAGGGTPAGYGGTWTKLETSPYSNIWDYTYTGNTLLNEFDNGSGRPEIGTRFWNDVVNNPIKIIASNTAGCTNFKRAFQGVNAITEIWQLDTSDATNVQIMCSSMTNLRKIPDLIDFSLIATGANGAAAFQYCWSLETVNELRLPDDNTLNLDVQNMFIACLSLKRINAPINLKACTSAKTFIAGCRNLEYVVLENTSRIKNVEFLFEVCEKLPATTIAAFDTSAVTKFNNMVQGYASGSAANSGGNMMHLYASPNTPDILAYDYTSATTIAMMYNNNTNLKHLTASRLATLKTGCDIHRLFDNAVNVESGILDTYTVLAGRAPSNHANVFHNCGTNTESGRAELALIPDDWK